MTLKHMVYQGYLGLDLSASDHLVEGLIHSAEFIMRLCGQMDIDNARIEAKKQEMNF